MPEQLSHSRSVLSTFSRVTSDFTDQKEAPLAHAEKTKISPEKNDVLKEKAFKKSVLNNLDNQSYINQANISPTKSKNVSENSGVAANTAAKDVVSANNRHQYIPGLVPPSVEANPALLDKQIAQLSTTLSAMTPLESKQVIDNIKENFVSRAEAAKVDIISIANGFTGRAANILQVVIESALEARKSSIEQREATRQVSYSQGQHAAEQKIQAGIDGRNNAITQGVVGGAMAIGGGAVQLRGLSQANKGLQTHGNNANELRRGADKVNSQAASTQRVKTDIGQDDKDILKASSKRINNDARHEDLQLNQRQNDAQKLQVAGNLASMSAMSVGTLAAAQGQVTQAESLAREQMATTNQNTHAARSEAEDRLSEAQAQLKAELLQLLIKTMESRANTMSGVASNVKC